MPEHVDGTMAQGLKIRVLLDDYSLRSVCGGRALAVKIQAHGLGSLSQPSQTAKQARSCVGQRVRRHLASCFEDASLPVRLPPLTQEPCQLEPSSCAESRGSQAIQVAGQVGLRFRGGSWHDQGQSVKQRVWLEWLMGMSLP